MKQTVLAPDDVLSSEVYRDGQSTRHMLLSDIFVSLGLVLSTATQLRPEAVPVGPGEVVLVVWIAAHARDLVSGIQRPQEYTRRIVLQLIIPAVVILSAGLVNAMLHPMWIGTSGRDIMAFLLNTAIVLLLLPNALSGERSIRMLMMISFATIGMVLFIWIALKLGISLPRIDPMWEGTRFCGWAENPNQLGLALVWIPGFLLWVLLHEGLSRPMQVITTFLLVSAVWLGYQTQSDALRMAWVVGIFFVCTVGMLRSIRGLELAKWRILSMIGLAVVVVIMGTVVYWSLSGSPYDLLRDVYSSGNQGRIRLLLWKNGLGAFMKTPLFGAGPGAHSGFSGPFEGHESHNSYIAWISSTGILGLIVALVFVTRISIILKQLGNSWLFTEFVTLLVFALFHNVYRHPMVWGVLLLLLGSRNVMCSNKTVSNDPMVCL